MSVHAFRLVAFVALSGATLLASAQSSTLFYGGDPNVGDGIYSAKGGRDADRDKGNSVVYDDFALGAASSVQGLFGNFQVDPNATITGLYYEIRQGVSAGKGGTLLFSGTLAATVSDTGLYQNDEVYRISGAPTGVILAAGTYFLGLAPALTTPGTAVGGSYSAATTGRNGVGSPLANGNSFVTNPNGGFNFEPSSTFGSDLTNFSYGVTGQPAPEPASLAALGLGALAVVRRRRRIS